MTVEVTHYIKPHGRRLAATTELSDELKPEYEWMVKKGWNFGAEIIAGGMVSLTIEDRKKGVDVEMRVVSNGPKVPEAMEDMLKAIKGKTNG